MTIAAVVVLGASAALAESSQTPCAAMAGTPVPAMLGCASAPSTTTTTVATGTEPTPPADQAPVTTVAPDVAPEPAAIADPTVPGPGAPLEQQVAAVPDTPASTSSTVGGLRGQAPAARLPAPSAATAAPLPNSGHEGWRVPALVAIALATLLYLGVNGARYRGQVPALRPRRLRVPPRGSVAAGR